MGRGGVWIFPVCSPAWRGGKMIPERSIRKREEGRGLCIASGG